MFFQVVCGWIGWGMKRKEVIVELKLFWLPGWRENLRMFSVFIICQSYQIFSIHPQLQCFSKLYCFIVAEPSAKAMKAPSHISTLTACYDHHWAHKFINPSCIICGIFLSTAVPPQKQMVLFNSCTLMSVRPHLWIKPDANSSAGPWEDAEVQGCLKTAGVQMHKKLERREALVHP